VIELPCGCLYEDSHHISGERRHVCARHGHEYVVTAKHQTTFTVRRRS
jgi:hypothetical protein